jgi:hypothetical protein
MTAIMRARSGEAAPTTGMLSQLISIVFVAATTIILFSLASFSFFSTHEETLTGSGSTGASVISTGASSPTPSLEPFSERDASASIQESGRVAEAPAISASETPSGSAPADPAIRTAPAVSAPDEIQKSQQGQRDQAVRLSDADASEQSAQPANSPSNPTSPRSTLQYRIKKECGPIINDRRLYRHCVSTFGVHYQ